MKHFARIMRGQNVLVQAFEAFQLKSGQLNAMGLVTEAFKQNAMYQAPAAFQQIAVVQVTEELQFKIASAMCQHELVPQTSVQLKTSAPLQTTGNATPWVRPLLAQPLGYGPRRAQPLGYHASGAPTHQK